MNINRWVRVFAGSFVLLSLILAHLQGAVDLSKPSWVWFTLFVGANLLQSGFTRFCPLEMVLRSLGVRD